MATTHRHEHHLSGHEPTLVPAGRMLSLPAGHRVHVRDTGGRPGAPTLVMLHGLGATGAVNWAHTLAVLAPRFRVVALDLRGHGRSQVGEGFSLEGCADDVVAVADLLGIDRFVAVGYSMGGAVALLTARRHPERVDGLVCNATAARFRAAAGPHTVAAEMAGRALRFIPDRGRKLAMQAVMSRMALDADLLAEIRHHDPAGLIEAIKALSRFDARRWVSELDLPAAVVVTAADTTIPANDQVVLAGALGATVHTVDGDHDVAETDPAAHARVLRTACDAVADRVAAPALDLGSSPLQLV